MVYRCWKSVSGGSSVVSWQNAQLSNWMGLLGMYVTVWQILAVCPRRIWIKLVYFDCNLEFWWKFLLYFLCFQLFNGTVLQAKTTHSCYELACKGWLRSPYLKELLHYYASDFFYSCAISVEMHIKSYVKELKLLFWK